MLQRVLKPEYNILMGIFVLTWLLFWDNLRAANENIQFGSIGIQIFYLKYKISKSNCPPNCLHLLEPFSGSSKYINKCYCWQAPVSESCWRTSMSVGASQRQQTLIVGHATHQWVITTGRISDDASGEGIFDIDSGCWPVYIEKGHRQSYLP